MTTLFVKFPQNVPKIGWSAVYPSRTVTFSKAHDSFVSKSNVTKLSWIVFPKETRIVQTQLRLDVYRQGKPGETNVPRSSVKLPPQESDALEYKVNNIKLQVNCHKI